MPTRQTNLTSETEQGAAVLDLDRPIALVKEVVDGALAAARPDASMAAPDDALSEKDAAGPTAATWSVLSLLARYWRAFQEQRHRQSLRATLQHLSDRELTDIGVTRAEIDYIAAHRAIDRIRDGMSIYGFRPVA